MVRTERVNSYVRFLMNEYKKQLRKCKLLLRRVRLHFSSYDAAKSHDSWKTNSRKHNPAWRQLWHDIKRLSE